MGKTTERRNSCNSLNTSRNRNSKTSKMSSKKKAIHKKNNPQRRNRKKIKTLFEALRRESQSAVSMNSSESHENTVIEVENYEPSEDNTGAKNSIPSINCEQSTSSRKRKSSNIIDIHCPKRTNANKTLIIIDEDEVQKYNEPCDIVIRTVNLNEPNCSTPINKGSKKSLQDLIESNFPNNNSSGQNFNDEVMSLTRDIDRESYVTIDLTKGTLDNSSSKNTVIDLETSKEDGECTIVSVEDLSTMSGDSNVTVIKMSERQREQKVHKYLNRLAKWDSSGKAVDSWLQKISTGCQLVRKMNKLPPVPTAEDTYIKEMMTKKDSRNSIGSNIYNPERRGNTGRGNGLRMVVIDGSNVAMEHGRGRQFSVKGLKICIDYFLKRGHVVKAFVPRFRCKFGKSSDPRLLDELERRGLVVYTPSREIQGRMVTSYDDRYIVQCAAEFDAVIVSGDNYRDLMRENPRWQHVIENRLLQFTWVDDMLMFPRDPLGRNGPTLEQFLKHTNSSRTVKA